MCNIIIFLFQREIRETWCDFTYK